MYCHVFAFFGLPDPEGEGIIILRNVANNLLCHDVTCQKPKSRAVTLGLSVRPPVRFSTIRAALLLQPFTFLSKSWT